MSATPNPAQVMSTLRMLGDKELAQYASMHKKDPYIFPLAFQESNLRKQMRAQGAGNAGPQPPVNDQALQTMAPQPLPEDVGLGRIAPPGVANMAGGGIVGFAGGGNPIEEQIMTEREEIQRGARKEFSPEVRAAMRNRPMSLDPAVIPGATGRGARPTMQNDPRLLGPTPAGETTGFAAERDRNMAALYGDSAPAQPPAIAPVPEAKPGVPPAAGLGALGMGAGTSMSLSQRGGAGMNTGPTGPEVSMPTRTPTDFGAAQRAAMDAQNATVSPFAAQREEVNAAAAAAAQRQFEGSQGIAAEQGKLYDKQEGRLTERAAGLEKEGKRNEAMSWITAGLEMMQARGPGLSAIAGGAQKGFSQYAAGLDKLKAAQERIDEAADRVAEARLGSKKEQLGAQREYDAALLAGKKDALADTMTHYNVSRQVATEMLKLQASEGQAFAQMSSQEKIAEANRRLQAQMNANDNATRIRAAQIGASASGAYHNKQLEYLKAVAGDPTLMAAHKAMEARGADPAASFVKFFSELPDYSTGKGLSKASPMNQVMSQWLGIQTGLGGISAPKPIQGVPGATTVRP